MKNRLLKGESILLENDFDVVSIWFNKKSNNFCLMMNGKVVKSTKTWKPIENKLKTINNLEEKL
jgi:hypothetical protein